jgi:mRNA interferase MazF
MPTTTTFDFGDVVLVPFPFTDQSTTKKRPAVLVSSAEYNAHRRDVILMAITSQMRATLEVGEAAVSDWRGAGLIKPSMFKPLLATIDARLVLRTMGRLQSADRETLARLLATILGDSQ